MVGGAKGQVVGRGRVELDTAHISLGLNSKTMIRSGAKGQVVGRGRVEIYTTDVRLGLNSKTRVILGLKIFKKSVLRIRIRPDTITSSGSDQKMS